MALSTNPKILMYYKLVGDILNLIVEEDEFYALLEEVLGEVDLKIVEKGEDD